MTKKSISRICGAVITAITIIFIVSGINYNVNNRNVLVFQFGKITHVYEEPGLYFTCPILQSKKSIFMGERLYDIPTTGVTTSDKKAMSANAYVTWKITDIQKYYKTLNSPKTAQSRIDTSVYSSMKNVISSTSQDDVISGKDGTLSKAILEKVDLSNYGIAVTNVEIKLLDLTDDNKQAVYERMISERNVIAAQYTAEGQKEASNIKSNAQKEAQTTISNAEAEAAETIAEGESQYYNILANAYSSSEEKTDFYKYWSELKATKEALQNGGTIIIDKTNPLYDILINK